MANRRIDAFFYGLFMDSDILQENHIAAVNPRQAYIDDYALVIGRRATLIAKPGARAYGMVISLMHDEIDKLYSGSGLEDYRPEALLVHLLGGSVLPVMCYNLLKIPEPDEANAEYARRLCSTLKKLQFPDEYIGSIA